MYDSIDAAGSGREKNRGKKMRVISETSIRSRPLLPNMVFISHEPWRPLTVTLLRVFTLTPLLNTIHRRRPALQDAQGADGQP